MSGVKKSVELAALPLTQRREIVKQLSTQFSVRLLCQALEVAPSRFY